MNSNLAHGRVAWCKLPASNSMRIPADKRFWLATIVFSIIVLGFIVRALGVHRNFSSSAGPAAKTLAELPPVMLWAWERPENLSFIDTSRVGVAFLAKTILLQGNKVEARPRMQPLNVPRGTKLIAVVRIETDRGQTPALTPAQLEQTVTELISTTHKQGILALQIDFDATLSQRGFYRELLLKLRTSLAETIPLSMTALASWCSGDNWLDEIPVDEVVPMLFRLGVQRRQFQAGYQFSAGPCKASAGISTDEPVALPHVQRLYIFNPDPWTQTSLSKTLEAYPR